MTNVRTYLNQLPAASGASAADLIWISVSDGMGGFVDKKITISNLDSSLTSAVTSVNGLTGAVVLTTSNVAEGSNLYFTNGRAQSAMTGAISSVVTSNLTADKALVSNGSGKIIVSVTTATELSYVSGVTSGIQTQINNKQDSSAALTQLAGLGNPGADRILFYDDSASSYAYLTVGTGLSISGTTITSTGSGGNVSNTGTPLDNQIAVWTNATTIEGTTGLTYNGSNLQLTGDIGSTGTRITKGWFTDLQVTNAIAGSITGNAATVTTNANLTGAITSVGNATSLGSFTSAQLAGALTNETGSGSAVFATSPTLVTPVLGAATATSINGLTITSTTGVLTLANGSTLVTSGANSITLTSTGATNVTLPTSGTLANLSFTTISVSGQSDVVADSANDTLTLVAGTNITITTSAGGDSITINASGGGTPGGSDTQVQYNNAGSFGGISGATTNGTALTLVAPILGTPASGTLTNCTIPVGGVTGLGTGVATFLATPSSANLASAVTGETGTGALVFGTAPTFASSITIGTAASATGTALFRGTTSGTVTLSVADAAGTWTMKLPTTGGTNGYSLTTDGSGNTTWSNITAGTSNSFVTWSVAGQSDVVADSSTDTMTLVAGSNMTITTDAATDTITFASSGGGAGLTTIDVDWSDFIPSNGSGRDPTPYILTDSTYDNGTGGVGATLTSNTDININELLNLNDLIIQDGDTIIVTGFSYSPGFTEEYNGIYDVTDVGETGVSPWILTRNSSYDASGDFIAGTLFKANRGVDINTKGGDIQLLSLTSTSNPTIGTESIFFNVINSGEIFNFTDTASGLVPAPNNGSDGDRFLNSAGSFSYPKIITVGDSGDIAFVIARAVTDTGAVGNVGGGTDDLITYTLGAESLVETGSGVRIIVWGTTANNVNAKTLTLNFGSTAILTNSLTASVAGFWRIEAEVFRTGTDAQKYTSQLITTGTAGVALNDVEGGTSAQTETNTIIIKCTGTATSNNDIVQEGLMIEFLG